MDYSPIKKILYVTHRVPYPPDKGDRIRTFHTLRYLSKTHQVYLASLSDELVAPETLQVLKDICEKVEIVPVEGRLRNVRLAWSLLTGGIASLTAFRSAELSRIIRSWTQSIQFDLAIASASSTAPYLASVEMRTIPTVVDLVDVDSEKWLNYAAQARFPKSWAYQSEGTRLRQYETQISAWAKAILLVSDSESALFRQIAPTAKVKTVTNGVDLDYFTPAQGPSVKNRCVFVGALDYHPNVDAVCWFASEVWPLIYRNHSDSTFQIVGRRPIATVSALNKVPGIEVVGQVSDVRPYVHEASVVIAPLRIARGLQNKVLEAMAMGKPVVASPAALAGLQSNTINPAVQAESVGNWVTAIKQLFEDSDLCKELSKQGREYVELHYHWARCLVPLKELIESLTEANSTGLSSSPAACVAI